MVDPFQVLQVYIFEVVIRTHSQATIWKDAIITPLKIEISI